MATGIVDDPGGVMSPADVHYAGVDQWERLTGMSPFNPLVGGPGYDVTGSGLPYNVDGARSRIVSTGADVITPMGGPGVHLLDDWRDAFNFKGSPVPWLLLFSLAILGFMQLRVSARAGKAKGNIALG
jgi:hypothetical protein